jgi:hypothetical protein
MNSDRPPRPRQIAGAPISNELWALIESCWAHQIEHRPTMAAVLNSPLFRECVQVGSPYRMPIIRTEVEQDENLQEVAAAVSLSPELPRRRPGPLNLFTSEDHNPPRLPSALATARIIDNLGRVPYPEGVKRPKAELNINARDGKFRYLFRLSGTYNATDFVRKV